MSKTRTLLWAFIVGIAIFSIAMYLFGRRGPDARQFKDILSPRIATIPDQPVLMVEATGDPSKVGGAAIGLLLQAYYKLPADARIRGPLAPRARWPLALDVPRAQWVGRYALPLARPVTDIPYVKKPAGLALSTTTWQYGQVAEVLHTGPYSAEMPTIRNLLAFINDNGLATVGEHEEEYVNGPGMFGPGDPKKYLTIIRYRVERR